MLMKFTYECKLWKNAACLWVLINGVVGSGVANKEFSDCLLVAGMYELGGITNYKIIL